MKKLLNTLFVTTSGAYLAKEGESVIVRVDHEVKLRVPIHSLGGIVCFGQVSYSPYLMAFCGKRNVTITHLSEYGRFLARVEGPTSGNVLLRRAQYRRADDEERAAGVARAIVIGKVANARKVLQRGLRDHDESKDLAGVGESVERLGYCLRKLQKDMQLDALRGIEGDASKAYFASFGALITAQKVGFEFHGRNRRPPLDNVNCLLSFIYTLLVHDCRSALETVGLDPQVGYLHKDRPGRPSLALDLMEEFRAPFADRLVLSLINRQQVKVSGFEKSEAGGVTMDDKTRKEVLVAYQKRKQEEIEHPFLGEKARIGLLFHLQAMLLARYLRGDLDGYPPFMWK